MPFDQEQKSTANINDVSQTFLRKVRSMESVLEGPIKQYENSFFNTTFPSSPKTSSRKVASKFSADTKINPMSLFSQPCINENEVVFSSSLDNHRFLRASSTQGLLRPNAEDNSDELGGGLFSRGILVGYVSVICLFIVTLKIHFDKNNSPRLHGQSHASQKLGAAALDSLTELFSPILPFTGGADLRRGEYSVTELLPTGTFDTWDSLYILGKDLASRSLTQGEFNTGSSMKSANLVPRGGAAGDQKKVRLATQKQIDARQVIVSDTEPFIHLNEIDKMTLADIATLTTYAIDANREGFNDLKFVSDLSSRMRNTIRAIDLACAKSRGKDVLPAKTIQSADAFGNIDALQFSAYMRIFAEWRVLRQVPEGYKGYAVGMGLGQKDVLQNLVKVETAIFAWIEERKEMIKLQQIRMKQIKENCENDLSNIENLNGTAPSNCNSDSTSESLVLRSPTLYELLKDEVDFDVHKGKLPKLKEKSAAMGLLWVRRQFQYQAAIFENIRSGKYNDVPEAVGAAYKETYDKYHGWAVQKIFNYSFKAAPTAGEIYKVMNPAYLSEVLEDARNVPITSDQYPQHKKNISPPDQFKQIDEIISAVEEKVEENSVDTEDEENEDAEENAVVIFCVKQNPFEKFGHFLAAEWDKLGQHINGEIEKIVQQWEKIAAHTLGIFGIKIEPKPHGQKKKKESKSKGNSKSNSDIRGGDILPGQKKGLEGEDLEKYVNEKLTKYAHDQMDLFLSVSKPILEDLDRLFEELNMNDPTKV